MFSLLVDGLVLQEGDVGAAEPREGVEVAASTQPHGLGVLDHRPDLGQSECALVFGAMKGRARRLFCLRSKKKFDMKTKDPHVTRSYSNTIL